MPQAKPKSTSPRRLRKGELSSSRRTDLAFLGFIGLMIYFRSGRDSELQEYLFWTLSWIFPVSLGLVCSLLRGRPPFRVVDQTTFYGFPVLATIWGTLMSVFILDSVPPGGRILALSCTAFIGALFFWPVVPFLPSLFSARRYRRRRALNRLSDLFFEAHISGKTHIVLAGHPFKVRTTVVRLND